ncbi:hypothetical protein LSUE1_G009203 [Lachnellula suecica]|uniref:Protein kinase domain-containing protein n=1 Tax=Lachnellula suecica TaxID=602035 RepID=A0A8T9BZN6_9HELO|nr:hypothetical protein LSUE1_G009203 [Lachnellula suecica]
MASKSHKSKAIVFYDEDDILESDGYLLVRVINHGTQGQTSIVRSLNDGKIYIRKKLIKRAEHPKTQELMIFCDRISVTMAPRVLQHFNGQTFECCGDGVAIPEALFWHLEKELLRILAFIHSGWQEGLGTVPDWQPITHADIHAGQIFLQWPEGEDDPFPQFRLGDWGLANLVRNHNTTLPGMWRRLQGLELRFFLAALLELSFHKSQDVTQEDCPIWLFQRLWEEAETAQQKQPELSLAKYIAEKFIPIADKKIQELQKSHFHDLRWTKPGAPEGFMTFGDAS